MKYDCSGYATKFNVKCSDGRTINSQAFKHHHNQKVPLVWQHMYEGPSNVLGHAMLEHREDGIYSYITFNDTEAGKNAKLLVQHGDVDALSIFANKLKQNGDVVMHGFIRELSLVLSGANPGALIDDVNISHSDTDEFKEVIIYSDEYIQHSEDTIDEEPEDVEEIKENTLTHEDKRTIEDVFNTLNEDQKNVVYAMLSQALTEVKHTNLEEEDTMKTNVFDKKDEPKNTLSHSDVQTIFTNAQKCGSFKEAFLAHVQTYGIENIDYLFPDAKTLTPTPDMISREMDWVPDVLQGAKSSPFSRIKSMAADVTAEVARARGYVKATLKREEVIKLTKRVTTPTTIYKKQKLDRDDIIDITDLDVVSWLKMEMRMMLNEEIARAILLGDGRAADHEDKINEEHIRPIYKDDDMYSHKVQLLSTSDTEDLIEAIITSHDMYEGNGIPTLFLTKAARTSMLLLKDTTGRRIYRNVGELASELGVSKIVTVPVMTGMSREGAGNAVYNLIGIMVNMKDYVAGADKGGEISMFDDFDIDYNQHKYLIETRMSGALTKPKSAIVFEKAVV
jgi:HK97 family phage prohead protease